MTSNCIFSQDWDCEISKENEAGQWMITIEKHCKLCLKAKEIEARNNTPGDIRAGLNSMSRREDEIRAKLGTLNKYLTRLDNTLKRLEERDDELEALAEKNQDKKDKIEAIIKLVNEYRLSEDHTLARAHIFLYKIDMDILSVEYENSIYSKGDV